MEVLKQTAKKHGLVCLLHEKPFAGINGSGKHNNWSLSTDTGINLLEPGDSPSENAQFLLILCAVIQAVDDYQDLLRASVASASNDHRLGGNEAPTATLSMFLGEELTEILETIEAGEDYEQKDRKLMKVGVHILPRFPQDTTDRNRTSPFAFTGNKFEFRAPGSSQNCAMNQMVLNTIVAESVDAISDKLDAMPGDINANLQKLLQRLIRAHKRVLFSGDGYSDDWTAEAARRGLPNLPDTPSAIQPLRDPANQKVFAAYGVLTEGELASRYEIALEDYHRRIRIEGSVALDIARSMVRPVVADEFSKLATALSVAKKDGLKTGTGGLRALSVRLGAGLDDLHVKCERLDKALAKGTHEDQIAAMRDLRHTVDALEHLVDDARWPLPKYREMLFIY
jgi:glutamine synthetase